MQHHYLKFLCGLSLIGLLATACQKGEMIAPDQSVSMASTSGGCCSVSLGPKGPKGSNKKPKVHTFKFRPENYQTDADRKRMLSDPQGNFNQKKIPPPSKTTTSQRPTL